MLNMGAESGRDVRQPWAQRRLNRIRVRGDNASPTRMIRIDPYYPTHSGSGMPWGAIGDNPNRASENVSRALHTQWSV